MTRLFLIWQDAQTRKWHPVARMDRREDLFVFVYTEGAKSSPNFIPFGNMRDLGAMYLSKTLFPVFANRIMSEKRPEYSKYIRWSGFLEEEQRDPLLLMARMGGVRATDSLQVYRVPERTFNGFYDSVFFCHGLRHMPACARERTGELNKGDKLWPMIDVQNPYDANAIALRSDDPPYMLGYCPRHLSLDLKWLLTAGPRTAEISVDRLNLDAPSQYMLLCRVRALWPSNFVPCSSSEYRTLVDVEDLLRKREAISHQG